MGVGSALGVTSEFAAAQAGGCARVEWLRGREDVLRGAAAAVSSATRARLAAGAGPGRRTSRSCTGEAAGTEGARPVPGCRRPWLLQADGSP